jgi:hypothetical protein
METKIDTTTNYTIRLNEEDAKLLRAYVQNFIGNGEEPEDMKELRFNLFHALTPNNE